MKRLVGGLIFAVLLPPSTLSASTFVGKSFSVNWLEYRDLVNILHNRSVEAKIEFHVSLYVSTKGRVFSKVDFVNNRAHRKEGLAGPGLPDGDQQWNWQWRLTANGITGNGHVPGGQDARLLELTMQGNDRCDAKVTIGKREGARNVVEAPGRRMLMVISDKVSDLTCTVQEGNILAGAGQ